ncbi:MAG: hypothetical protein ACNA7W_17865 [Pseudomonadales bacterium]
MLNKRMKPITLAVGSAFAATFAAASLADVQENPFAANALDGGYDQLAKGDVEGKCGEGKCGEGKCGEAKDDTEGKCGEGKCGEGKCGEAKDDAEGKCGEGKCGEGKCGGAA